MIDTTCLALLIAVVCNVLQALINLGRLYYDLRGCTCFSRPKSSRFLVSPVNVPVDVGGS